MSWLSNDVLRGGARKPVARSGANSVRSVNYSTSPLLASKTPPWRSKFLVAVVGLSFCEFRSPFDNKEFLDFRMVVVPTASDTSVCREIRKLP